MANWFCEHCGKSYDTNIKFCTNCGNPNKMFDEELMNDEMFIKEARIESGNNEHAIPNNKHFESGKCPSCGSSLSSFSTHCNYCGSEIRTRESSKAAKVLVKKLSEIDARQMSNFDNKKSVMKTVFGRDFKNQDEYLRMKDDFEKQKEIEKASLIKNFAVPNSKEDILEFMLLASSNIQKKSLNESEISKAWRIKLEQIYQKAEIVMRGDEEFSQIQKIYEQKNGKFSLAKVQNISSDSPNGCLKILLWIIVGYAVLVVLAMDSMIALIVILGIILVLVSKKRK